MSLNDSRAQRGAVVLSVDESGVSVVGGGDGSPPVRGFTLEIARISKMMQNASCGPLIAAAHVMKLAADWEQHRADAGGDDASAALKKHLGQDLSFFARRHEAVERLGEDIRRWLHHDAAVWISRVAHKNKSVDVIGHVRRGCAEHRKRGHAVTKPMALPYVHEAIGRVVRPKACSRCAELLRKLEEAGIDPDK